MNENKRRVGRPPKPVADRKRNNLTIRIGDSLRGELEGRAAANERSLSEEVARRLGQTIREEEAFGGVDMRHLMYAIVTAFVARGSLVARDRSLSDTPSAWLKDPESYRAAMQGALEALALSYPGDLSPNELRLMLESTFSGLLSRKINAARSAQS